MEKHNSKKSILIYIALALSTFLAFEQVRLNDFISYDDFAYVTENPDVSSGLSLQSVGWAFKNIHVNNWHPLTGISHMLDCSLFGLNSPWHHLVNLLFHITNTLLVFAVLRKLTNCLWQSAFVAALFALHPLHVESVAWVAERKDVLSTFFFLLTIAAYARYAKQPNTKRYILIAILFTLALMSKPMVVTLPFVLLLLDYWPLARIQSKLLPAAESDYQKASPKNLMIEKIPLFALAAISSVVTFLVQRASGAVLGTETLAVKYRTINALVSYSRYIGKTIYPANLSVFYPHSANTTPLYWPILSALVLIAITTLAVLAKKKPYLAPGWLWFLGTLVPVIGIIQVGTQAIADRYMYIPSIGLYVIIAWAANDIFSRWKQKKLILSISAAIILTIFLILTRQQLHHWKDGPTLYKHAFTVTKNNLVMHYNYADAMRKQGRFTKAIEHFKETVRINQKFTKGHNDLALAYYVTGQNANAITSWNNALKQNPDFIDALNNLAWLLATSNDNKFRNPIEAIRLAQRSCELTEYSRFDILDTLAASYATAGRFPEAIATAEKALKLAKSSDNHSLATEISKHLRLYKEQKPYIENTAHVPSQ